MKHVKRYDEILVENGVAAKTVQTVSVIPGLFVDEVDGGWRGKLYNIEAAGIPVDYPDGGHKFTGKMFDELKECIEIARTFSQNYLAKHDPQNRFFSKNW